MFREFNTGSIFQNLFFGIFAVIKTGITGTFVWSVGASQFIYISIQTPTAVKNNSKSWKKHRIQNSDHSVTLQLSHMHTRSWHKRKSITCQKGDMCSLVLVTHRHYFKIIFSNLKILDIRGVWRAENFWFCLSQNSWTLCSRIGDWTVLWKDSYICHFFAVHSVVVIYGP